VSSRKRTHRKLGIASLLLLVAGCAALDQDLTPDTLIRQSQTYLADSWEKQREIQAQEAAQREAERAERTSIIDAGRNFFNRMSQPSDNESEETSNNWPQGIGSLFGSNQGERANDNNGSDPGSTGQNRSGQSSIGGYQIAVDPYATGAVSQTGPQTGGQTRTGAVGIVQSNDSTVQMLPSSYQPLQRPFTVQAFDGRAVRARALVEQLGLSTTSAASGRRLPPVAFDALPDDMATTTPGNKDLFLTILIPIAVLANEQIAAERRAILQTGYRGRLQGAPIIVKQIASRYGVQSDVATLLDHVDTIPVSLILAQAIEETGWGTSRFAQEGNALFGQYTWNAADQGMIPSGRPAGQSYRVRAFPTLLDAMESYVLNLNRHQAYASLRATRALLRTQGRIPTGLDLVGGLAQYTGDPGYYLPTIERHLRDNNLALFDRAAILPGAVIRVQGAYAPAGGY